MAGKAPIPKGFRVGEKPVWGGPFMQKFGRIVYEVFGTLNAAGDNCVLLPTFYGGTSKANRALIGPGRVLDPARWFIVIPNMLGNGVSSSPSNDPEFEPASIAENVRLQHELLQSLGVRKIALIHGWSMGAMQGFAWAAMYPDMVQGLLAVCGTARCWPLNFAFLEGVKAAMGAGPRAFGRAYAGWAYSAQFYRDALYQSRGYATLEDFLASWEDDHEGCDERNLLTMLWTWQNADLGLEDLAKIKARVIVMPCASDMYFTVEEAKLEAAAIPGAELCMLNSPWGHCAGGPSRFVADPTLFEDAMRVLLPA
jgi:homoserine O-acetyltransferase